MVANLSFNPFLTTNAAGSFDIESSGYVQGTALDQPSIRNSLSGGILSTADTLPMWGGVGIAAYVPTGLPGGSDKALGTVVRRATSLASTIPLLGFSVFDQDYAMVNYPQSPVPLAASSQMVNYYLLGSGARIVVQIDPALVSLAGGLINQQVSWDFNNQVLQPFDSATATVTISSMTWSSTNGGQIAVVTSAATVVGAVGDNVNISGATNAGTGGNSVVNGDFVVTGFTDNEHFTVAAPASSGVITTISVGSAVVNEGTGALSVEVLDVNIGNSMTVNYNSVTGYATWNRQGSTAVIKI